jgi:large subunit ribosomal protein L6
MSRIGKMPISLPQGVSVNIDASNYTVVKGPMGQLERQLSTEMKIEQADGVVRVDRPTNQSRHRQMHGLTRTLLANMVKGVSEGYSKKLEVVGVGYRAAMDGPDLVLNVGLS